MNIHWNNVPIYSVPASVASLAESYVLQLISLLNNVCSLFVELTLNCTFCVRHKLLIPTVFPLHYHHQNCIYSYNYE